MRDSIKILAGGKEITTRPYARGGGRPQAIPDDEVFAGRMQGGGTRTQVYGTRAYGSGYPAGGVLRGTSTRGFPFYFWPVVWASPFATDAGDAYLHPIEYGLADNSTRPGGALTTLTLISRQPSGTTFRILTDHASASALIPALSSACSSSIYRIPSKPLPYLSNAAFPLPEQALQYYRASSAVLTLDGYNNTGALIPQASSDTHNVLLPSGTDTALLRCLNATVGRAVLMYDPPRGLDAESIVLIVLAAVFVALVGVLLALARCRRHRETRRKPSTMVNPIRAPPPAVIHFPSKDDETASITECEDIEMKGRYCN